MHLLHKHLKWILPITLLALTAHGADIAGKWSGLIEIDDSGGKIETPVDLYLEQKAGTLTGKNRPEQPSRERRDSQRQDRGR